MKTPLVKYNPEMDEFTYEYVNRLPTIGEELLQLKAQQILMQQAIDDIIMEGMM